MEKLQNMKNFVGGISYFVYNCLKMKHKSEYIPAKISEIYILKISFTSG